MRVGGYELVITDIALRTGAASVAATEWRVSGQVRVVAPFEQAGMDAFYDDIDVLLVPSLWKESFGLVVREALARGIWVIATAAGGVVEDIVDGVNGRVVEIGDTDAFRGAIEDALASPDRLPAGGVNAMLPRIRGYDEQATELKAYLQRIAAAPAAALVVGTTRRAWRPSVIPIAAHGPGA
jgi:glycosyltransferase involved in cell wall biosynthesis